MRPYGAWSVPAVLLVATLAGCLAPVPGDVVVPSSGASEPLTEPTFAFGDFLSMKVASFDGVELHVDVQLPEGEGPFPTLVEYTPYSALGPNAWGFQRDLGREASLGLANRYVPLGYAVAVAHVRGTGESGGCLTVGAPAEGRDGYSIVEAIANESWSSGRVALIGTSYVGTTPIETAIWSPPHLTTIVPISSVSSWYHYYFENGEPRANGDPPPGSSHTDALFWAAMGVAPGFRTAAASPDDAPCVAEFASQYWLQDDYDAWWHERDHAKDVGNITVPVLYAQGFQDENVATTSIPLFWPALKSEKRMWLQQHAHGVPSSKEAYYAYQHRWLDHFMMDKDNGALSLPAVVVEDNLGGFRAEPTWPPADTTALRFWLADGALVPDAPAEGAVSYRDDGVGDENEALDGVNHVTFLSEPLAGERHVAGSATMHLVASSSEKDTQFAVHVYDVGPDGERKFLTRGYMDARHRDSLDKGEDLAPGTDHVFHWALHPRDHRVEDGHRLLVLVKSADHYVIPDATRAENTVRFGPEGSWIEFPLQDDTGVVYADDAPAPWT